MKIQCLRNTPHTTNESPFWSVEEQALYWVNLTENRIHRLEPATQKHNTWDIDRPVSAIVRCGDNKLLLSIERRLAVLNLNNSQLKYLTDPICVAKRVHFNDAKCDSHGRYWVGTYNTELTSPEGGVFMYEHGQMHSVLDNMIITNGIAWNLNEDTMYVVDTLTRVIHQYAYSLKTGKLSDPKTFVKNPPRRGYPDGITLDSEDHVWVAHWRGGRVVRYTPQGKVDRIIRFPTKFITSCCFGGKDLKTLYVTASNIKARRKFLFGRVPGTLYAIKFDDIQGVPSHDFNLSHSKETA